MESDGSRDNNDSACWTAADTITQNWDRWDVGGYWSSRWGSKDAFSQNVAPSEHTAGFFEREIIDFFKSDASKAVAQPKQWQDPGALDLKDYVVLSLSFGFLAGALIVDDYGNVYLRGDNNLLSLPEFNPGGVQSPGAVLALGSIGYYTPEGKWVSINDLGLTHEELRELVPTVLVGGSHSINGGTFFLNIAGAVNSSGAPHITAESGVSYPSSTVGFSLKSTTMQIWPKVRLP